MSGMKLPNRPKQARERFIRAENGYNCGNLGGNMEAEDVAAKNAEYARIYWVIDFALSGAALLERSTLFWKPLHAVPIDLLGLLFGGLSVLYCLFPLVMGQLFRRLLKRELEKESLSMRMFEICDWRIAQLLFAVYMGMLIFKVRA